MKPKQPYQGSAKQLRRLANRRPNTQPVSTRVMAISLSTGEEVIYETIRRAAEIGGFEYSSIRNCLHGRQKSHAGFRFEADTPLRAKAVESNITKVAALRNQGLDNQAIADKLGLVLGTVAVYGSQAVNLGLTKRYRDVLDDLEFANTKLG